MSDRTAASLFGKMFSHLAEDPTPRNKEFARELWSDMDDYDFRPYQMDCDESLIRLDLAYVYPTDEVISYGPVDRR